MTQYRHLVSRSWDDYELLDSGENMKLERFGSIVLARPEMQALWKRRRPELWQEVDAEFAFKDKKGVWDVRGRVPETWQISWKNVRASLRLTSFKHIGIFPEQSPNWEWVREQLAKQQVFARKQSGRDTSPAMSGVRGDPRTFSQETPVAKVLNLFGYTGIASIVAAQAGAFVTHVDASKQSLDWAHENARLSGVGEDGVRWILDDALAFVKREARRKAQYDGIILDPPVFGRGSKGEVWRIEEDLPKLLETLKDLLSSEPGSFFLLNGYAAGYASRSLAQAVESAFPSTVLGAGGATEAGLSAQAGELHINESSSERVVPAGIYVRFMR